MHISSNSLVAFVLATTVSAGVLVKRNPAASEPLLQRYPATNAERLARGLAPKAPTRRSPTAAHAPRASALPPISKKCRMQAVDAANGTSYGFVSANFSAGAYGDLGETSVDGALDVSFSYSADASPATRLNFATPHGANLTFPNGTIVTYPFIGAVLSKISTDGTLNSTSSNYAFLSGTTESSAGSVPFEGPHAYNAWSDLKETPAPIESAIWGFDSATEQITVQWVNPDGSTPATHLVYDRANKLFALVGSVAAYNTHFAPAQTWPEIKFFCVE